MSTNLSKIKRDKMLETISKIKENIEDDETLKNLSLIEYELTKKKYYQSVFLEIENNNGNIVETGTEINFIEILKYLKDQNNEESTELKKYFEKLSDYVLLVGIKMDRKK